jgi:hypothetical protein
MRIDDIEEGKSYVRRLNATYFRTVEMIVDAPNRPGGKLVAWSTEGFAVANRAAKMHGKCGIKSFAAWARAEAE